MAGLDLAGGGFDYSKALWDRIEERRRAERKLDQSKVDLLADPAKMDKLVSEYYSGISPAAGKVKKPNSYATKVDAVDAAIPEDHPQKGRPQQFRDRFTAALQDSIGYDEQIGDVLGAVAGQEAKELRDAPYRYKREKDAKFLGLFGGDDETIKKPPGYDEWREEQNRLDDERYSSENDILNPAKWAKNLGIAGALGAVVGGAIGGLSSAGAGLVPGAIAGAKSFMLWEAAARPVRAALQSGEWYQANMGSDSLVDKGQAIATDLGLEMAAGIAAAKLFEKPAKAAVHYALDKPFVQRVPRVVSEAEELRGLKAKMRMTPEVEAAQERFTDMKALVDNTTIDVGAKALPAPTPTSVTVTKSPAGMIAPKAQTSVIRMPAMSEKLPVAQEMPLFDKIKAMVQPEFIMASEEAQGVYSMMTQAERQKVDWLAAHLGSMEAAVKDVVDTKKLTQVMKIAEVRGAKELYRAGGGLRSGEWTDLLHYQGGAPHTPLRIERRFLPSEIEALEAEGIKMLEKHGFSIPALTAAGLGTVVGGSVLLSDLVFPDEAQGGLFTSVPKMFAGAVKDAAAAGKVEALVKKMGDAGLVIKAHVNPRMAPERFQQPLNVAKDAIKKYGSLEDAMVKGGTWLPKVARKLMTAGGLGDLLYKQNANAAVAMASVEQATVNNQQHILRKVLPSILERVKGSTGNSDAVIKRMEPLARQYVETAAVYESARTKMDAIEEGIKGLKKMTKGMKAGDKREFILSKLDEVQRGRYQKLAEQLEEYAPKRKAFMRDLDVAYKELAQEHAGTRLALAAEDTADFKKYPWLKALMSAEELEATTYIKALMRRYGDRIERAGHDIITGPYMHHARHPIWGKRDVAEKLSELQYIPGESIPFTKFFSRARSSRQLVPDIEYIMNRYVPDAERRINWSKFWDSGWREHAERLSMFPQHKEYWDTVKALAKPAEATSINKWANRYYAFEAINILGGSVAAAAKHLFKIEGTMAAFGVADTLKHSPLATMYTKRIIQEQLATGAVGKALGIKGPQGKKLYDEFLKSFTAMSRYQKTMAEMDLTAGIENYSTFLGKFDRWLQKAANTSSGMIKAVEWFDRAHSVIAATEIAAKKGLTVADAEYMVWDTIIKNNFLGGSLNPLWQKDPLVRAVFMFQNTPYKILERRLVTAIKSGKGVVRAGGHVFRNYNEQVAALNELQGIGRYVKGAEKTFKAGVLADAVKLMTEEKGAAGSSYIKQFIRDTLIGGAVIYGGGKLLDAEFTGHVVHFPFLKPDTEAPVISVAPILTGTYKTLHESGEDADDFMMTRFAHNWLGKKGLIPQQVWKMMRLTNDDIPEIYRGSKFKYLFSVPAKSAD